MVTAHHTGRQEENNHSARDARQGEIILARRWQKYVFITGLVLFVALLLLGAVITFQ